MGAFICSISPRDWPNALRKGIYGNKLYKRDSKVPLADMQQLSIIRDLISMKKGDLVFFHVIGEKTVHGIYQVSKEPFYDETKIWDDDFEPFPYRFQFKPHPDYEELCLNDASISVHSFYEIIDKGDIRSLVSLEFEQNIERRSIRRLLDIDIKHIIKLLLRDFSKNEFDEKIKFDYYSTTNFTPLKEKVYSIGRIENAITAVIMYELSEDISNFKKIIGFKGKCDFANEFFVAPTTRKAIDIFTTWETQTAIIECKSKKVGMFGLQQGLYYRDLIYQQNWYDKEKKITLILVGSRFHKDVTKAVVHLNKIEKYEIKLIKYNPIKNDKWGDFSDETPKYNWFG